MSINLKQLPDSSAGLEGTDLDVGSFIYITVPYNSASVTQTVVTIPRRCIIQSVRLARDTGSTNAVTAQIVTRQSTGAIATGTAVTDAVTLQGPVTTSVAFVPVAAQVDCVAGTRLGVVFSGALGAAGAGNITIALNPA